MIKNIDFDKLKDKFGILLSHLSKDGKLNVFEINQAILDNDFFDFLENNKAEDFLDKGFDEIFNIVFKDKNIAFVDDGKELVMYFWAGMEYINIAINESVPLRKIFLVLPLEEMLSLYDAYHEMNDYRIIEKWREVYSSKSVLSILCKRKGITQKELSIASGIDFNTIKYYCKNNDGLLAASYSKVNSILNVLNVTDVFIKKESEFIPYDDFLTEYAPFKAYLEKNIEDCLSSNDIGSAVTKIASFLSSDAIPNSIKEELKNSKYVIIYQHKTISSIESKNKKQQTFGDKIVDQIIKKSVKETIEDSFRRGVLCF